MENPYINSLLEREEIQFYINSYLDLVIKKNQTTEKYRNLPKTELLRLYELINLKKSNLSKRERDVVIYFAEKEINKK